MYLFTNISIINEKKYLSSVICLKSNVFGSHLKNLPNSIECSNIHKDINFNTYEIPNFITHLSCALDNDVYELENISNHLQCVYVDTNYVSSTCYDRIKMMFYNNNFVIKHSTNQKDMFVKKDHKLCKRC